MGINQAKHIDFQLIGIGNQKKPAFQSTILELIANARLFAGGKRHYQLVKSYLPENHIWMPISGAMTNVVSCFKKYSETIVIFVSGDPFFYGFGNTLKRLLPNAVIQSHPYFNSIQLLCAKAQVNYNKLKVVSLHGRPLDKLDEALLNAPSLLGILTDTNHSPALIAQYLLDYNFNEYEIIIGEELTGEKEKIHYLNLCEASQLSTSALNCCLLVSKKPRIYPISFPDHQFNKLEGRPNLITKQAIRIQTINSLQLHNHKCFWDIGSCTGAIAIEAKLNFPHLKVVAFEKRAECQHIISTNAKQLSVPGIQIEIGDFLSVDLSTFSTPDVIFIGGHGNQLASIIEKIKNYLAPGGSVVMNTIKDTSAIVFQEQFSNLGFHLGPTQTVQYNEHNSIKIITATHIL